jgi:hypothetical protein
VFQSSKTKDARAATAAALRRTLSRNPTEHELELLHALYRQRLMYYTANPEAVEKLLRIGASPTDLNLDHSQVAAMADVCLVIFNLSETITRK